MTRLVRDGHIVNACDSVSNRIEPAQNLLDVAVVVCPCRCKFHLYVTYGASTHELAGTVENLVDDWGLGFRHQNRFNLVDDWGTWWMIGVQRLGLGAWF
jgi:hypothetical protein